MSSKPTEEVFGMAPNSIRIMALGAALLTAVALVPSTAKPKTRNSYDDKRNDAPIRPPKPPKVRKGIGISAWGLLFLVITFIMIGVGIYYGFLCYPILCTEERKYDRIELSPV